MHHRKDSFRRRLLLGLMALATALTMSCEGEKEHMAEAINDSDSLPMMHSTGINTLISDSGVMRYRMMAEEWDIYNSCRGCVPAG